MSTGKWRQNLAKFSAMSGADKWMLLHATVWLAMARVMLLVMPFKNLSARLSADQGSATGEPDPEFLKRVGYAVQAAANNVPWRSNCFPQCIAGWMLLKHHGFASTIHLGVGRVGDGELSGHAWLTCGDTVVTGGDGLDRYVETHRLGA